MDKFEALYQQWLENHSDLGGVDPSLLRQVAMGWYIRGQSSVVRAVESGIIDLSIVPTEQEVMRAFAPKRKRVRVAKAKTVSA